ncbi:MAG: DNA mismatch repair protein MutS, partial [Candidatus Eremiobacteraeota bacterium]|nr:DNA mismatch repair protein MutS [Candidatus Eremiobacteraeota bacterium]
RLVGARAVIRRLFELQGLGLVTTHDLALTELADDLGPAAANVHFEDQWSEGVMSFDYHLRSGVIARSNALELMRAVGLQV